MAAITSQLRPCGYSRSGKNASKSTRHKKQEKRSSADPQQSNWPLSESDSSSEGIDCDDDLEDQVPQVQVDRVFEQLDATTTTTGGHTAAEEAQRQTHNVSVVYKLEKAIAVVRSRNSKPAEIYDALIVLRASAEAWNPKAQYALASCFELGIGVKPDMEQALIWYKRAAGMGLVDAQYTVGFFYEHGRGTQPDEKQAVYWYQKAEKSGCKEATVALMRLKGHLY